MHKALGMASAGAMRAIMPQAFAQEERMVWCNKGFSLAGGIDFRAAGQWASEGKLEDTRYIAEPLKGNLLPGAAYLLEPDAG
jgi:hypothetical protein